MRASARLSSATIPSSAHPPACRWAAPQKRLRLERSPEPGDRPRRRRILLYEPVRAVYLETCRSHLPTAHLQCRKGSSAFHHDDLVAAYARPWPHVAVDLSYLPPAPG